jgi:hypothetical protein
MSRKSSQRRIEANRRNAQKSTGPRTEEGKARASQNAVTHGLSAFGTNPLSSGCFLHTEDETRFGNLLGEYLATYQPRHRDEYDLLTEAVYAKWRQQRIWLAETAQLEIAIARNEANLQSELPAADEGAHLANAVAHSENTMRLYLRYGAQLHRQYLRCLKELRDLQDARRREPDPPNEPTSPAAEPPPPLPSPTPDEAIAASPNQANLTPEQARFEYMKAEIARFDAYRASLERQRQG